MLKEKVEPEYGEYRTRRLVLEAWDRLEAELGPVIVRNYREEMADAAAQPAPAGEPTSSAGQPDLFGAANSDSKSGRMGVPPQGRPAPTGTASSQEDARPQAPQARFQSPPLPRTAPRPEPPVQPVLIPSPPQGNRSQRLSRLLTLGRQRTPEAVGELVAALGDGDEQLRWLAALELQGIGGAVIATLKAFIEQAPSGMGRQEATTLLVKLQANSGEGYG